MFKTIGRIALASTCLLAVPAAARAQQTVNFSIGYFAVRGGCSEPSAVSTCGRVTGDQVAFDQRFLSFNTSDLNSVTVGGEWLVPIGRYFEGGAGVSFSRGTAPSVYTDYTDTTGAEIEQELKLRIVPVAFSFRVLPLGQTSPVQPYFGGGLGIFSWRYEESGDFIDFAHNNNVFQATYVGSGTTTGPIVLGGIRFAGKSASAGFEVRYQRAEGDLPVSDFGDPGNPNPKIDLGGWSYQATVGLRLH